MKKNDKLIEFKALLAERKNDILSGRTNIGLGCLKRKKFETERRGFETTKTTSYLYSVAPLVFDTSPGTGAQKYETRLNCPMCGRAIRFIVKRHESRPKVRLAAEEKVGGAHENYIWPIFLHKMLKAIKSLRVLSIGMLFLLTALLFLFIHWQLWKGFPTILTLISSFFYIAFLIFFIIVYSAPEKLAIKHVEYGDKQAEETWR